MEKKIALIDDIVAALSEAEAYLAVLLDVARSVKTDVKAAGTDLEKWEALADDVRRKCKDAMPYSRIHLGNFLLNLNARVSNMPLIIGDIKQAGNIQETP